MKINEFMKDVDGLAKWAKKLNQSTDVLKANMEMNITACLADIDPDVLEARIHLVLQQAFLQSWSVMKKNVAELASQHPDEDIEFLLKQMLNMIDNFCEVMSLNTSLAELDVDLAEQHFDDSLDQIHEDE